MSTRHVAALLALLLASAGDALARRPDGGQRLPDTEIADEVSAALDQRIVARVERNLARLRAAGTLPAAVPPKVSGLAWPLGPNPGPGREWHAISGFVDLNPTSGSFRRSTEDERGDSSVFLLKLLA